MTVDRAVVSSGAVRLFDQHGYDATSMDDVAAALGVSRRSLFRHFPVKAELVWYGFEPFLRRFGESLDTPGAPGPVLAVIEHALVSSLAADEVALQGARVRLALIHRHAELRAFNSAGLGEVRDRVRALLERRLDLPAGSLESHVLADAVTAAAFAALRHWAVADGGPDPEPTLHRALAALVDLLPR